MRPPAGSRSIGKSHFDGSPSRRLKTPTAPRRSSAFGFLVATIWAATPLATLAETPVAHCIAEIRAQFGTNPAFKVTCSTPADCEFEPSQAMNASAMAFMDATARTVTECWQKAGLTIAVPLASPPEIKVSLRRYRAPEENGSEVCSIAELKPLGEQRLTTSFRAACLAIHAD